MENSPVTGKRKLTGPDSADILSQPSKSEISEIAVESKIVSRTCVHEVTVLCYCDSPKGETFHQTDKNPIYSGKMGNKYIFVLYPFGKTAVAEYAMVMSFHDDQRAIYTSALMVLSNQEYNELNQELSDVWLMAGDVTTSPYSSCVVLNTENFGGMPYSSSKLLKGTALVIFDKIHYMKDRVKVVVWEETIIFLPAASKKLCLLIAMGGSDLYLFVDENEQLKEDTFTKLEGAFMKQKIKWMATLRIQK
ncbi:DEAD-box ATP-dependent RNA helicase ISE2, chloroplastic [Apostasia shenzhenica]|uniref:DEAD-box ATP-dependent RNA helicase ISE2, chloroplastic n=1 Tax=Apostasia shenzhenica TaxID=1088818 RepID=A0A2I0AYH8_9ASPA|nr:DEAD-box ATP-dependent RNA helicase ISE2, chloroplastic [Apostasia shenzhenica]